jgi:hypothetical protein
VISTSDDGELIEEMFDGGSFRDRMYKIVSTSDGGYILAGFTWSFGSTGNGYLMKITTGELPSPSPEPSPSPGGGTSAIPGFSIVSLVIGLILISFILLKRKY